MENILATQYQALERVSNHLETASMVENAEQFCVSFYHAAKSFVISEGFEDEISWQHKQSIDEITESTFLKEGAWVILNSGFRESHIRKIFSNFSLCFMDWESASAILQKECECRSTSLRVFGNKRKVEAIIAMAKILETDGFSSTIDKVRLNPIIELQKFPMIGKITAWHLAKNLGVPVAKHDRHLANVSSLLGYNDAHHLCESIGNQVKDSIPVIDLVLWRFATLVPPKMWRNAFISKHVNLNLN